MSQPLDLDTIRHRVPLGYEGPWYVELDEETGRWSVGYPTDNSLAGLIATVPDYGHHLAEFIAHARQDVPALLDEVERFRADSVTLNSVLYRVAEALSDRKGEKQYVGSPLEQITRLIAERDEARVALRQLVTLKDGPRDDEYERRKPAAWEAARRALDGDRTSREGNDDARLRMEPVAAEQAGWVDPAAPVHERGRWDVWE